MLYLITDQDNRTWRNVQWAENTTNQEDNPNYHFIAYNSPLVATYIYRAYDNIQFPKIWTAKANNAATLSDEIKGKYSSITSVNEFQIDFPNKDQAITFAILCAMNLTPNQDFKTWAINYLKGVDISKETAHKINELLLNDDKNYVSTAIGSIGAVLLNDPFFFAANAAHRSFYDSKEFNNQIDLEQIAQIVNMLPAKDIAEFL
jgi:hypothetical protein